MACLVDRADPVVAARTCFERTARVPATSYSNIVTAKTPHLHRDFQYDCPRRTAEPVTFEGVVIDPHELI